MRWDNLKLDDTSGADRPATLAPALFERGAVTRRFDTPGFRGITFYEIQARSIINKVPEASRVPFRWTINPYRGCSHGCTYCFARKTHSYLDLDSGLDFESKIVVKVNAPELARKELASARWQGEHVAMGTNVDCYQRGEGRYRLMPGIISALRDAANPFSILTKGTLILRDLGLLLDAAQVTDVGLNVSVGFVGGELWRLVEPGTPSPRRRLDVCAALADSGLACGVLMAPIIPFLSDSRSQLAETVREIATAGACHVSPIVLHLRPGAREWFGVWLREHHPRLLPAYRDLYGNGSYARKSYQQRIDRHVRELAGHYGVGRVRPGSARVRALPQRGASAPEPADRAAGRRGVSRQLAEEAHGSPGPARHRGPARRSPAARPYKEAKAAGHVQLSLLESDSP